MFIDKYIENKRLKRERKAEIAKKKKILTAELARINLILREKDADIAKKQAFIDKTKSKIATTKVEIEALYTKQDKVLEITEKEKQALSAKRNKVLKEIEEEISARVYEFVDDNDKLDNVQTACIADYQEAIALRRQVKEKLEEFEAWKESFTTDNPLGK
uniref:hypothetical protein n=1 Tax=Eubacterium cellulosolvens TaxID=29322 RepID=UPI0004808F59|nr:hypothetical protein [[Eubacterium] cellulosolvens]